MGLGMANEGQEFHGSSYGFQLIRRTSPSRIDAPAIFFTGQYAMYPKMTRRLLRRVAYAAVQTAALVFAVLLALVGGTVKDA
jgi:hypothetical protein